MLQNLGFEGVQISFYWQAHTKMISQLVRSERMSLYVDPRLAEFHRLFAQMDILQHKLIKFWSRDTLICDNVLGSGSPTPPGVEFWRIKIRFYPAGHRKTTPATKDQNCRAITLRGKTKGLKKVRILNGLFDKIAAGRNQGEQQ